MVATRKSEGKGGSVASMIIFGVAALLGASNAGSYTDLKIWSGLCAGIAVLNLIAVFTGKKSHNE